MEKTLLSKIRLSALFLMLSVLVPLGVGAKSYLTENFAYSLGNLYQQGGWLKNGTQTVAPIQVVDQPLTYPGYLDEATGYAVELNKDEKAEDLMKRFVEGEKGNGVKTGSLYLSALINVKEGGGIEDGKQLYVLGFIPETSKGNVDNSTTTYSLYSRLFVIGSENEGKFKFGLSRLAAQADVVTDVEYDLNTTYLVVMKYEFVEGSKNDIVTLWVNPATDAVTEPTSSGIVATNSTSGDISITYGATGICLYQGGSTARTAPHVIIDALRVTDTWAELFGNGGGEVTPQSKITVSATTKSFWAFAGQQSSATVNVKGENLTDDITISGIGAPFSVASATISKDEAMSATGADITINYAPTAAGEHSATMTLASGGALATVSLSGYAESITSIPTSVALNNLPASDEDIYLYSGKATITYIDAANHRIYAQDMTGALCFDYSYYDLPVSVGDVVTGVAGYITKMLGVPYFTVYMPYITVTSTGASKEPLAVTVPELLASPESYIHRLVKIEDVTFTPAEGQTFTTSTVKGKAGDSDVTVFPFAGTSLIGTPVPEQASVVGISRSLSIASVSPRSADDIILPAAEPSLTVTPLQVFKGEAAPIGVATELARYTVEAANLPSPVSIYLTGANRTLYSLSAEAIPAGTSTTVITVTYTPTAIGKHTGRINFDTTPTELATGYQFTTLAYDPANPPAITVAPTELPAFAAKVGETQVQQLTVTGANFPDNGTIRVMGESKGAFVISSTLLGKYAPMNLNVTFQPKAEGTYTERIQFAGVMADTVYVTVTGTTTGGAEPEVKEGDELTLSALNPRTLLNEPFDGVTRNKPIAIDGWKNVALQGTRAWWGYDWTDPAANSAAKITAYDSKVADGADVPCSMMLVTPPLDFKNAASRMLTFRIMGEQLTDNMTESLEVCYIDLDGTEMSVQPIAGIAVPASPDLNGEWQDFVVDLDGNDLADVFFIGFRYTAARGRNSSAVYYVDDVTYGRTDIPFIKPAVLTADFNAAAGTPHTETYTVEGRNLTGAMTLSVSGANASKFSVSPTTLPAEGGEFTVTFLSDEVGIHEAEVLFSAEGAPVSAMLLTAHNREALKADFTAEEAAVTVYYNGFDSEADFSAWTLNQTNSRYTWTLGNTIYGVSDFSAVNPDSKSSLAILYDTSAQNERITSPAIDIPEGGECTFYSGFSPIWLYQGHYNLYVNKGDGTRDLLLNTFLWSQYNPGDDAAWHKFTIDLAAYAGQTVTFTFEYVGSQGESMLIDDFTVRGYSADENTTVSVNEGDQVHFLDLSIGTPVKWSWTLPGASVETSTAQNPVVTYPEGGTYDVTLTVTDAYGNTSTITREGFVTVMAQAPQAIIGLPEGGYLCPFGSVFLPANTPLTFTDLSTGSPTERTWKFTGADVTTSSDAEVTVTYTTPGDYSVDLEVKNAAGTSKAYHDGVLVGGENHIWNISLDENSQLAPIPLGFYGYYGGTNWLGMTAFGEHFDKPMMPGKVSSVDIYFASVTTVTPDAPITVSVVKPVDGLPGEVLASAVVKAADLKYSETTFMPTTFTFDAPVAVDGEFFITVAGIPNNQGDDIYMFCSPRRADGGKSTVYHELELEDENYQPTGEYQWYKNEDEFLSFALAPKFAYDDNSVPDAIHAASTAARGISFASVNGNLCVSADADIDVITLTSLSGVAVRTAAPGTASATLSVAGLPRGVYVVSVKVGKNVITRKVTL